MKTSHPPLREKGAFLLRLLHFAAKSLPKGLEPRNMPCCSRVAPCYASPPNPVYVSCRENGGRYVIVSSSPFKPLSRPIDAMTRSEPPCHHWCHRVISTPW